MEKVPFAVKFPVKSQLQLEKGRGDKEEDKGSNKPSTRSPELSRCVSRGRGTYHFKTDIPSERRIGVFCVQTGEGSVTHLFSATLYINASWMIVSEWGKHHNNSTYNAE